MRLGRCGPSVPPWRSMDSPAVSLSEVYRQAFQVGEQLLSMLVERQLDDVSAAEFARLLAERGHLAAQAEERLAAGERTDDALRGLRALLGQQQALEAATKSEMAAIHAELGAALHSKGVVGSTSRLLGPRIRSHSLDTYK